MVTYDVRYGGTPQRKVIPPTGYPDDPDAMNEMLSKESLTLKYHDLKNLEKPNGEFTADQREINDLLANDLLKLSLQDRNAVNEEIHGVQTIAPQEDPTMIRVALIDMEAFIEEMPWKTKVAYLRSQELYPNTYINTPEFRLRFLRCDLFDAKKAAIRMVNFLDLLTDLFGDYVLKRPLQISDFSWEEMQVFRRGHFQLLPYRDRSGRRIFAYVGGLAMDLHLTIRVKIMIYLLLAASDDVESQRKGITSVVWPGVKFKPKEESSRLKLDRIVFMKNVYASLPIRTASLHFCFPDSPFINVYRAMLFLSMPTFRIRMKFHSGENVEVQYILKGYGIPSELIPLTDTGNIKTIYLKQWLKLRKNLDALHEKGFPAAMSIIECPGSTDVVFRPGTSVSCHPGNVRFRCLLESFTSPDVVSFKTTQAEMAEQIVRDIEGAGGRFLKWDNKGYWTEMRDRVQVHNKVALSIRDFKYKTKAQRKNRQNIRSYTYMFCQNGQKRKRDDEATVDPTYSEDRVLSRSLESPLDPQVLGDTITECPS